MADFDKKYINWVCFLKRKKQYAAWMVDLAQYWASTRYYGVREITAHLTPSTVSGIRNLIADFINDPWNLLSSIDSVMAFLKNYNSIDLVCKWENLYRDFIRRNYYTSYTKTVERKYMQSSSASTSGYYEPHVETREKVRQPWHEKGYERYMRNRFRNIK